MIIDQLTGTLSDNLTDEIPVEQGTSTLKTTWQKILNLFRTNLSPTSGTPAMDGVATQGSATTFSKSDHVHPTDTSRASVTSLNDRVAKAGDTMSGNLTIMSGNLTISSTSQPSVILKNPLMDRTAQSLALDENSGIFFADANDSNVGRIDVTETTDGTSQISIRTIKTVSGNNVDNYVTL